MSMVALRVCWFNVWNAVVLNLDEQQVRLYWRMFELEGVIAWCSMQYGIIILSLCAVQTNYYNGNGDSAFVFVCVGCMERCHICPAKRMYVVCIVGVCLNLKVVFVFDACNMRSQLHLC